MSVELESPRSSVKIEPVGASDTTLPPPIHSCTVWLLWSTTQAFAVIFLIVLIAWIFTAEGGLGFDESSVFGWHALCMGIFVAFFTQGSVLWYTSPIRYFSFFDDKNKGIHVALHSFGAIIAMLGIVSIVYYKSLSPQPIVFPFYSVYSPHSWLGIAMLVMWGIQFLLAIVSQFVTMLKTRVSKVHKFCGKIIFVTGLATCALGFQDMQSSDLASSTPVIPGIISTLSMNGQSVVVLAGNITMNVTGYFPNSLEAQYSCACTILLLFLGIATFAVLEFGKDEHAEKSTEL